MEAVLEALKRLDWSPLYISIRTGIVATIISFFLGIFAARKVLKASDKVRAAADGILTMPLVLPPTVAGFFLLLFFSRRRPLGILLYERFGIKVVQSWLGCIIAATVIAFPLMYRNARAAFEQIDANLRRHEYACRKHTGKDGHSLPEDRHGHSGRGLCDSRSVDGSRDRDRVCVHLCDEPDLRKGCKRRKALVRYVSASGY